MSDLLHHFDVFICGALIGLMIGVFYRTYRDVARRPAQPVHGWEDAFSDSRSHGHHTDAYTFQIAWAYARDHFEPTASPTSNSADAGEGS
ncbi:MAG TPA: hypothetical protein VHN11_04820 [Xanthobacteraceae bacterium]|jgi:hypothetical protein|nr:hypothetical protein [Xanthobacteraceae bacterium]